MGPHEERGVVRQAAFTARRYATLTLQRYWKLHIYGKIFVGALIMFYIALVTTILVVTPARIAQALYDVAQDFSNKPYGWLLLIGLVVLLSFPPAIGHTTSLYVCGFAYGLKGFPVALVGSILGSTLAFVTLRLLFSRRLRVWSSTNERWQALEAVVTAKGLPLVILIRASSFPPWVYSNVLFASIEAVSVWQFIVATACIFPRFLLYVFIGSRTALLSDGKQRDKMDTPTKVLNGFLIGGGILISILASWVVYNAMQRQLREFSPEIDELAEEALEEANEGAPLLDNFDEEV